MRLWYLGRAIPWVALLSFSGLAVAVAASVHWWPGNAWVMLPLVLACCAAGAGFVFDERAATVVAVTPRGATWRRAARMGVVVLPLGVWSAVVLVRPGDLPLARPGWWLLGAATIALTAGLAASTSRGDTSTPGSTLAAVVMLAVLAPVVAAGFLGLESPFPLEGFPSGVLTFWLVIATVAAVLCGIGVRPPVTRG